MPKQTNPTAWSHVPQVLRYVGALAVVAILAAACGSNGESTGDSPGSDSGTTPGGQSEIVIAQAAWPSSFASDLGIGGSENQEVARNLHANLVRNPYLPSERSAALEQDIYDFEGVLAESYDVSEDGLVYTFHLREGVPSHAGNELTADDIIWTFDRRFNAPTATTRFTFTPIITEPETQLEKIDDYTVSFTLHEPGHGLTFLGLLSNGSGHVYDSTLLQEMETDDDPYAVNWSAQNGNYGFGPYSVEAYTPDEELIFAANPDYALGAPEIERIVYRVAADPGTRANLLRSGDADVATNLLPTDQVQLADEGVIDLYTVNSNNLNSLQLVANKPPFDETVVRQAFTMAVPYEQIIENVYFGRADRTVALIPPYTPGWVGDGLDEYEFDPDGARELLESNGYDLPIEFTISVSNAVPDLQQTAIQIQSFAADAGFDVSIEEIPPTALNEGRTGGTFQAYLLRQQLITMSPPYILRWWFQEEPTRNISQWFHDGYTELVAEGTALPDSLSDEAGEIWNAAEQIMVEEAPAVFIGNVQPLSGFAGGLGGYAWRTDNILDYSLFTYDD